MIVKEYLETRADGVKLYRSYSDANMHIQKVETGDIYSDAIDVESANYVYIETDIPIIDGDIEGQDESY